jgi:hypothetical protein
MLIFMPNLTSALWIRKFALASTLILEPVRDVLYEVVASVDGKVPGFHYVNKRTDETSIKILPALRSHQPCHPPLIF